MDLKKKIDAARPLPCVRDEHGEIREQTVKQLFTKINEKLDELKTEITYHGIAVIADSAADAKEKLIQPVDIKAIAEEAADTITAITTMLEALGIDAEARDEAQRRVNQKNREWLPRSDEPKGSRQTKKQRNRL